MTSPLFLPIIFSLVGAGFTLGRCWDRLCARYEQAPSWPVGVERSHVARVPAVYDWATGE